MEHRNGEYIENFLKFLRDAQTEYNITEQVEVEAGKETQDILHRLELENDSYHDIAKLSRELRAVRKKRRAAKDAHAEAEPVVHWMKENDGAIRGLERALGDIRKVERYSENRCYISKTGIVEEVLKKEASGGEE